VGKSFQGLDVRLDEAIPDARSVLVSAADADDEWDFLTFDPDVTCPICGEPIHAGQAVGRVRGTLVHARCTPPSPPSR